MSRFVFAYICICVFAYFSMLNIFYLLAQVDQSRYGFDQVNYSSNPPSTEKKKEEPERKYPCDQCSYIATQKSSLSRHVSSHHIPIIAINPFEQA